MKAILLIGLAALVAGDGGLHHHHGSATSYGVPPPPVHISYAPPPPVHHSYQAPPLAHNPPPPPVHNAPSTPPSTYVPPETPSGPYAVPHHEAPSNSYGVPHVPEGPYAVPHHEAPSNSYGVPHVPEGPYASKSSESESASGSSSSSEGHADDSYQPPAVPSGPYGAASADSASSTHVIHGAASADSASSTSVIHVPGVPVTTNVHTETHAPYFVTEYKPAASQDAHPPSPGYHVPAPSPSYGVPSVPAGSYPAPSHVSSDSTTIDLRGPSTSYKAGQALVRTWLTQTALQGGGVITEKKVPDGYGGYKTETAEEWHDSPPEYKYSYDISGSLADTSAQESRSGDRTSGRYTVKQPDGKTRIVEYTVDEWGFKPTVTFV